MKHLRRYSIYFKSTRRLITQSKIKAITYILQILTLPMTWKSWQKGCPLIKFFGSCFMHEHALLQDLAWMSSCFTSGTNASRATNKKDRVPLSVTVWDNLHDTSCYCRSESFFIPVCVFFVSDLHQKSFCNSVEQSADFRSG